MHNGEEGQPDGEGASTSNPRADNRGELYGKRQSFGRVTAARVTRQESCLLVRESLGGKSLGESPEWLLPVKPPRDKALGESLTESLLEIF
jgi:hypothetical protein